MYTLEMNWNENFNNNNNKKWKENDKFVNNAMNRISYTANK